MASATNALGLLNAPSGCAYVSGGPALGRRVSTTCVAPPANTRTPFDRPRMFSHNASGEAFSSTEGTASEATDASSSDDGSSESFPLEDALSRASCPLSRSQYSGPASSSRSLARALSAALFHAIRSIGREYTRVMSTPPDPSRRGSAPPRGRLSPSQNASPSSTQRSSAGMAALMRRAIGKDAIRAVFPAPRRRYVERGGRGEEHPARVRASEASEASEAPPPPRPSRRVPEGASSGAI